MKSQYAPQIRRCIQEWFKNHRATFAEVKAPEDPRLLVWSQPQRSTYLCRYIIDRGALLIWGDIGEAVYRWGQMITWDFLASCDLEYFAEKCCASEVGRNFVMWDGRKAERGILDYFQSYDIKISAGESEDILSAVRATTTQDDYMENIILCNRELFPDPSEYADWGETIHTRCIGHWVGIQMAMGKTEDVLKRYEI